MRKIILLIFFSILPINCFSVNYWTESKYASLKKEKVYARWNASFHAKPRYIYQKKHFPVLIINEHDVWREIYDIDGKTGWVHTSMISSKKTFINNKEQNLLKYKDGDVVNAIVRKGVVGEIIKCEEKFCKVKIKPYKGWVEKEFLWGIKKN